MNAAMPYTGEGTVSVFVPHAVMHITQGICRLTVFADTSSLLKIYHGRIEVQYYEATVSEAASAKAASAKAASDRPERPRSNKTAWHHLVKTMHQLYIRSDGTSTNPFRFMVKPDENEWVLWNREQDKKMGTPAE